MRTDMAGGWAAAPVSPPTPVSLSPTSASLVGRAREQGALDALVSAGRRHGGAVLLVGPPGSGRTALLAHAARAARAAASEVVSCTGSPAEVDLPYAGLHQVLVPLWSAAAALSPAQREALLTALDLGRPSTAPPFLVALAALELLVEGAIRQPLVVLVDDLHGVDVPTQQVLAFVARRVARHRLAVVAATHPAQLGPLQGARVPEIHLRPLTEADARALLDRDRGALHETARDQILLQAAGNPLALLELAPVPRGAGLPTGPGVDGPVPERLRRSFAAALTGLPLATLDAVLLAALDAAGELRTVLAAVERLSGTPTTATVLAPAVASGLVSVSALHVRFFHPLARAAVLDSSSLDRRVAAAAALGAVVDDPYRRACLRSESVVGPDEDVADALEAATLADRGHLDAAAAVWGLERSARLTCNGQTRLRRLLAAARHAATTGRRDLVVRLVDEVSSITSATTDVDRARLACLQDLVREEAGTDDDAARLIDVADRAAAAGDSDASLELLLVAAWHCWWAGGDTPTAGRLSSVARRWHHRSGDPRYLAALALARPMADGAHVLALLGAAGPDEWVNGEQLFLVAAAAGAAGDSVLARTLLTTAAARLRQEGRDGSLTVVLSMLAEVHLTLGDWDRSAIAAAEAGELAVRTGQPLWAVESLVLEATCRALRGESEAALAMAAQIELKAAASTANRLLAGVQLVRGLVALASGSYGEAYSELSRVVDRDGPCFALGGSYAVLGHFAEAAAGTGRVDEARSVFGWLESSQPPTPSPDLHLQLLYGRALLAPDQEAETLHREALSVLASRPWLRARLQVRYASWLRRRYRVGESRSPLRGAVATFEALGATGWAAMARVELRAAGERLPGSVAGLVDVLSPQEQQIVRYAADGLTNREIGERLYLSPRTVGSHLYRIFPKLGVTSRVQLAGRVATGSSAEAVG